MSGEPDPPSLLARALAPLASLPAGVLCGQLSDFLKQVAQVSGKAAVAGLTCQLIARKRPKRNDLPQLPLRSLDRTSQIAPEFRQLRRRAQVRPDFDSRLDADDDGQAIRRSCWSAVASTSSWCPSACRPSSATRPACVVGGGVRNQRFPSPSASMNFTSFPKGSISAMLSSNQHLLRSSADANEAPGAST